MNGSITYFRGMIALLRISIVQFVLIYHILFVRLFKKIFPFYKN